MNYHETIVSAAKALNETVVTVKTNDGDGMACLVTRLPADAPGIDYGSFCARLYDTDAEECVGKTWFSDELGAIAYAVRCCR